MATKKLDIYTIEDIEKTPEKFVHNNAFIKPNGDIFIAKGYTGMNPSHQLESSALSIGRNVTDKQLSVMEELYDVNDDGTLHPIIVNGEWDYVDMVFTPSHNVETKEEYSQYILSKKFSKNLWHI